MARNRGKKPGVGAVCRAFVKYMHPSELMRNKFVNITAQLKISDLIAIRQEVRRVRRKEQMCIIFRHPYWENQEIYCCKRWVRVLQEGHQDHLFDPPSLTVDDLRTPNTEEEGIDIPVEVFRSNASAEDIANVRRLGLDVDDDNEPAPENIPSPNVPNQTNQS